jgi:hypothetical protein
MQPYRLVQLMRAAIARCDLDLAGRVVLTEAASGAYVTTPVLAAMAGAAHVFALARDSRFGSAADVTEQTMGLARLAGVHERVEVIGEKSPDVVAQADIVTNSGHIRPIDAGMIGLMKPSAVIPLMYETWELREADVDLAACRRRGIRCAGTNETHPAVDVFPYLGMLAVKLLHDAGVAVYASRILVLCNNLFGPYIRYGLVSAGARVDLWPVLPSLAANGPYDALLVAMQPRSDFVLAAADAAGIARDLPGMIVAQFWGDIERPAFEAAGVPVWPLLAPARGHMGILLSAIGPEPIIRLQAGGLKVAQLLGQPADRLAPEERAYLQPV